MITLQQLPPDTAPARGAVLYRGPSRIDGGPVAMIATFRSENSKTGDMVQTWILRSDVHPLEATRTGADASTCGQCPHRPVSDGTCYVNVGQAPAAVWRAYSAGRYQELRPAEYARAFGGRAVRLGAYGDPAAVPLDILRRIVAAADRHTGYTHQWRRFPGLRGICMASADTLEEHELATSRGWRTFRVLMPSDRIRPGAELECPAGRVTRSGRTVQCADCGLCSGASSRTGSGGRPIPSIAIAAHGGVAIMRRVARIDRERRTDPA